MHNFKLDQNLTLSNKMAGFFDHQYIWKEAINVLPIFFIVIATKEGNYIRLQLLVGC